MNGRPTRNQPQEDEHQQIDPFLQNYNPSDLQTVSEFLSNWLPFLSKDLCNHCSKSLSDRVRSLDHLKYDTEQSHEETEVQVSTPDRRDLQDEIDTNDTEDTNSLGSWKDGANWASEQVEKTSRTEWVQSPEHVKSTGPKMSWADMAQEEFEADEEEEARGLFGNSGQTEGPVKGKAIGKTELSREQRERIRFTNVTRKKDFICLERVNGKIVNVVDGLELHSGVFSLVEQKKIVDFVYELQEKGKNGKLKARTYTAPQKWMRGKGRVTIQFGCCYNYATDRNGNPPGILHNELVDPIPHLFKVMIKRLVKWHVIPPTCVPDSCIVNIYDEGDCIPPHIDNHDFVRPFCTVSFLSECNILFGTSLKIEGPGEFSGSFPISLPIGSVLVLNGNGADVAKHCVPAVPTKRISITFRKMDETKWPNGFVPEPDLQGLEPLSYDADKPNGGSNHLKRVEPPMYDADKPSGGSHHYKPNRPSNRQVVRRDDFKDNSRGVLGSHPRFYGQSQTRQQGPGQSQTRQQGPSPGYRRNGRLEY
ncbi:RNA demethylase ALKBH9B-like [Rutidosis leptorrhynchoides]|uniref:RNA demethylase ALKBH9B-like n=1 Tax=Rutidosis leptorrhynchoides TaxID=125765 RepID=UPI003A9971C0